MVVQHAKLYKRPTGAVKRILESTAKRPDAVDPIQISWHLIRLIESKHTKS